MTNEEFLLNAVSNGFWWSNENTDTNTVFLRDFIIGEFPKSQYSISKLRSVIEDHIIKVRLGKIDSILNNI